MNVRGVWYFLVGAFSGKRVACSELSHQGTRDNPGGLGTGAEGTFLKVLEEEKWTPRGVSEKSEK